LSEKHEWILSASELSLCSSPRRLGWCGSASGCRRPMSVIYLVSFVIALALLAYLFVALMRPEWFA